MRSPERALLKRAVTIQMVRIKTPPVASGDCECSMPVAQKVARQPRSSYSVKLEADTPAVHPDGDLPDPGPRVQLRWRMAGGSLADLNHAAIRGVTAKLMD